MMRVIDACGVTHTALPQVSATSGDTHLGGEDFDERVVLHLASLFEKKSNLKGVLRDKKAKARLRRAAERAKRELSSSATTRVEVDSLFKGKDFSETLSRARFESLNSDLFAKTLGPVSNVLKDAKLKKSEIDEIVLVGGSTRIPKVQELVQSFFGGKLPCRGVNPDEAVAHGAAVQGAILSKGGGSEINSLVLLDVTPISLGIRLNTGVFRKVISRQPHYYHIWTH